MQMGDYNELDGFSSNQQQDEETMLAIRSAQLDEDRPFANQLVLKQIQPPMQIKKKHYSLEPDIITGWMPKMHLPKPVRLIFENPFLEQTIQLALANPSKHKLCYLGARFNSTYSAWKVLNVPFPYHHLSQQRIVLSDRAFTGMHPKVEADALRFDSLFESGNLDAAFRVGEFEYNCFMRVDANTKGHLQWYYFKMANMAAGQKYRINLYNFQKAKTLYARGMRPYIFSRKQYMDNQTGWHQDCQDIVYLKNIADSESIYDRQGKYFKLSFTISTEYEDDIMEVAYCPPYTYSKLNEFLSEELAQKCIGRNILSQDYLCISLGGLKVPLLTITSEAEEEQVLLRKGIRVKGKRMVFIMGRVHPGESNGSFMVEGFLRWLCGHSPESCEIRQRFVFKILPMANPDGVVIGNYRTGLSGKDFNREFPSPDQQLFVEVHALKELLRRCKGLYGSDFTLFLDFHGHTVKKNVFTYGPQFPITDPRYYECRLLPKLIGRRTQLFRFHSCIFRVTPSKEATARAVLVKELKIPFAYTLEASNGSYYDQNQLKDVALGCDAWLGVGGKVGEALFDYWLLVKVLIKKREERNQEKELARGRKDKGRRIQSSLIRARQHSGGTQRYKSSLACIKQKQRLESQQALQDIYEQLASPAQQTEHCSDDQLSEGRSDSQSESNDLPPGEVIILQASVPEQRHRSQTEKRSYVKILKSLKKNSLVQQSLQVNCEKQKERKLIEIPREKVQLRKKVLTISGTPSPVKESEPNTAKIINISFALNPIPTLMADQRSKKLRTETAESKGDRRVSRQQQFDSYRKTYLSLQRESIKKEDIKRKSNMNNTFSNGNRFRIQEIVGRRIFTETSL